MNNSLINFSNLVRSKSTILLCILITLILQLSISATTIVIDSKYDFLSNQKLYIVLLISILSIILIFPIFNTNTPFIIKQILFGLNSIIFGLLLSQLIIRINDYNVVKGAAIATMVNFIVLFIFGLVIVKLGINLEWMGALLLLSLLVLITIRIITIFTLDSKETSIRNRYLSIASVIIFSLYIVYDTNIILNKYDNNSTTHCVRGALDYYLDIINLFINFINLKNNKINNRKK